MSHKHFFAICAAISMLISSCKKDEYWGEISALKNGGPWEAKIRVETTAFSSAKVEIFIETFDKDGFFAETLVFFKVPTEIGVYSLSQTVNHPPDDSLTGCHYLNSSGDQLLDIFVIGSSDSTSYIEITEYNEEKGELRGKFNVILWPEPGIPGSWNAPDSLIFSDGVFHTRLD